MLSVLFALFTTLLYKISLAHLYPGDGLLGLHHPRGLGGLALAHQLGAAQVARAEEDALNQNFGIGDGSCNQMDKCQ